MLQEEPCERWVTRVGSQGKGRVSELVLPLRICAVLEQKGSYTSVPKHCRAHEQSPRELVGEVGVEPTLQFETHAEQVAPLHRLISLFESHC